MGLVELHLTGTPGNFMASCLLTVDAFLARATTHNNTLGVSATIATEVVLGMAVTIAISAGVQVPPTGRSRDRVVRGVAVIEGLVSGDW